jgi:hypothetical protein
MVARHTESKVKNTCYFIMISSFSDYFTTIIFLVVTTFLSAMRE